MPASAPSFAQAAGEPFTLLHTNDIHDVLKNGEKGGMAFVSTYIHQIKAEKKSVLAVNAGDSVEKGDEFSVVAKGLPAYQALQMTGTDVTVVGNHDFTYGLDQLIKNVQVSGVTMLAANVRDAKTKQRIFPATKEFDLNGVRVGVIGGTIAMPQRGFAKLVDITPPPEFGKEVDQLAREMEPRVDLTILVYHIGLKPGQVAVELAPTVDVLVCGHANEITQQPIVAKTGALIVEAGRGGELVGQMDIKVDKANKKIAGFDYKMVKMDPKTITPDPAIVKQTAAWEKQYLPNGPSSRPAGSYSRRPGAGTWNRPASRPSASRPTSHSVRASQPASAMVE